MILLVSIIGLLICIQIIFLHTKEAVQKIFKFFPLRRIFFKVVPSFQQSTLRTVMFPEDSVNVPTCTFPTHFKNSTQTSFYMWVFLFLGVLLSLFSNKNNTVSANLISSSAFRHLPNSMHSHQEKLQQGWQLETRKPCLEVLLA